MSNNVYVIYDKNNSGKYVVGWSNTIDIIKKYLTINRIPSYKVKSTTMNKFIKRFGNVDELEIIETNDGVAIKDEIHNNLQPTMDEELYNLASCISYMSKIKDRYNLSDKELKHINKSIDTMKYLFDNIEEGIHDYMLKDMSSKSMSDMNKYKNFV